MKKKILKAIAMVLAIILIIGVGVFANAFVGNPVSKYLATKGAKAHLEKTYGSTDFQIEEVIYDFKTCDYSAKITSPTSIDSHFTLSFNFTGKLTLDTYDDVTSGWNTACRLDEDYRNLVKSVTESKDFPKNYFIAYGEIPCVLSDYPVDEKHPDFALQKEELVLDKTYDIRELGAKSGKLIISVYDEAVTEEKLSEILLEIKERFDKAGVTFKGIDCRLEPPMEEGIASDYDNFVEVRNFLYSDINEDGLLEKVKKANKEAHEYHEEQESVKEAEIKAAEG
ncbi:MAG: hypothetical protein IKC01_02515 [Clostridia bacterium]|nr:hypothetical protein [Clostridia bacterium]